MFQLSLQRAKVHESQVVFWPIRRRLKTQGSISIQYQFTCTYKRCTHLKKGESHIRTRLILSLWSKMMNQVKVPVRQNRPWAFPRSPVDLWFSLHWGIVLRCQPSHCWPGGTSHVWPPCMFQRPAEGTGLWWASHQIPPRQTAPCSPFGARLVSCPSWGRWWKIQTHTCECGIPWNLFGFTFLFFRYLNMAYMHIWNLTKCE